MKEQEPKHQKIWLLSSYDFNNGFWQDKKETFNQTFTQQGQQFYLKSGSWEIYREGNLVARAQETVFGESGLPVTIITPSTSISPEDQKALLAALERYHAKKEENLKL